MWFFAQEMRDSTTRGVNCLSSSPSRAHRLFHDGLLIAFVVDGEVTG